MNNWDHLISRWKNNKLPHALLLSGVSDVDKQSFALNFAKLLLCQQENVADQACGVCHACQLIAANAHPDFYHLQPEAAGKTIRIDQIRELIAQLSQTAHQGLYKIALIDPADAMPIGAANALLKTLEEPSPNTLLMLISHQPGLLPATIRSRCQVINFQQSNETDVLFAIQNSESYKKLWADLMQISQNKSEPIQIAAQWAKEPLSNIVNSLIEIVMGVIRTQLGIVRGNAIPAHVGIQTNPSRLFLYLDQLYQLRQNTQVNLNQQLLLESLFCTWQEYTAQGN